MVSSRLTLVPTYRRVTEGTINLFLFPCPIGVPVMAFDQRKSVQTIWAILLTIMGVLLCVKTPYALRQAPESGFLNFARYFVAVFLIAGGVRKLYTLYFPKPNESSHEE
jgi:hypothetical protein